jgi:hypothetical protein
MLNGSKIEERLVQRCRVNRSNQQTLVTLQNSFIIPNHTNITRMRVVITSVGWLQGWKSGMGTGWGIEELPRLVWLEAVPSFYYLLGRDMRYYEPQTNTCLQGTSDNASFISRLYQSQNICLIVAKNQLWTVVWGSHSYDRVVA